MGCQLSAYGRDSGDESAELNWSSASYAVMGLTARWFDRKRDVDEPGGWYQMQIDESAIAKVESEAPHDLEGFKAYCLEHLDRVQALELDDTDLLAMRAFISKAAAIGRGVSCSH